MFLLAGLGGVVPDISFRGETMSYGTFAIPGLLALVCTRAGSNAVADFSNDRKWGVFSLGLR